MENTDIRPGTNRSGGGDEHKAQPLSRADRVWRAFLALLVVTFGLLIAVLAPLLAIACTTCQDGVRNSRYTETLTALAWYVVPATTLATVVCLFLPRRGPRLAVIGIGILAVTLVLILGLGQIQA